MHYKNAGGRVDILGDPDIHAVFVKIKAVQRATRESILKNLLFTVGHKQREGEGDCCDTRGQEVEPDSLHAQALGLNQHEHHNCESDHEQVN